jgi:hypothetical protein
MNRAAASSAIAILLLTPLLPAAGQDDHPPIPIRFETLEPGFVSLVGNTPTAVLHRPPDPAARGDGVTDQTALAAEGTGNCELSVPVEMLKLALANGQTVAGDVGVLRGNGHRALQRIYCHNKSTSITADIPAEAELRPELWGEWRCAADGQSLSPAV